MKHKLLISILVSATFAQAQIWQSDFSNASEWISTDLHGGSDQWLISSTAIGGDVDSINSLSAGSGFAQFNSSGQCAGNHQDVVLTWYQLIDISSYELSYIEFVQHYKRKNDSVYVEFSSDGFTWESIRINKEYWYNQQTDNPDTVRVSIPASVQAQPFYLRFRFTGDCGFAWLMDDVKIFEKEQYDINFVGTMLVNGLEYYKINHCIVDTVDYNVKIENTGYDTLFDVNLELVGANEVGNLSALSILFPVLLPNEYKDTTIQSIITEYVYSDDFYTVTAKVFSSILDTITQSDSTYLSNVTMTKNSGDIHGVYYLEPNYWGIGQTFIIPDGQEYCTRVEVYFPENIGSSIVVYAMWFRKNNSAWIYNGQSEDYVISTGEPAQWWWFGGSWMFQENDTAMIALMTYGQELPVAYSKQTVGNDIYFIDDLYNQTLIENGHSLIIRALPNYNFSCSCFVTIEEQEIGPITIYPNPASTKIDIEPVNKNFVSYSISSVDGRLICDHVDYAEKSIPIDFLSNGIYILTLETDNGRTYVARFIKE